MRKRDAVGRKIVRVLQERTVTNHGKTVYNVYGLVLDNGTTLVLSVAELESDYAVEVTAYPVPGCRNG